MKLDQALLQLDREGTKEREDGERGGGGGDYSREAINRGTAIIRGNTVSRGMILVRWVNGTVIIHRTVNAK